MALPVPVQLFWSFAKVGLIGYGGGPAMLPLIEVEVVEQNAWMTHEQFVDGLAAGYSLPGPISTKIAIWVGWETNGLLGASAALLGVILPSAILILLVTSVLHSFADHPRVQGMLRGVRPVMLAILVAMVIGYVPKTAPDVLSGVIAAVALGILMATDLHPAWLVLGGALLGGAIFSGGAS